MDEYTKTEKTKSEKDDLGHRVPDPHKTWVCRDGGVYRGLYTLFLGVTKKNICKGKDKDFWRHNYAEGTVSYFAAKSWESIAPRTLHLKYGEGPIEIRFKVSRVRKGAKS